MTPTPKSAELHPIPGLPLEASDALLGVLAAHRAVEEAWLYGSRAMNRHRPASDVDLSLYGGLNDDLRAHVQGVGRRVLRRPIQPP